MMSLSAEDRKHVWQDHRDSLTRIKTQLSDRKSPVKVRTPIRSPAGRSHSPYGRYRQTTPPYLPRLDTPPDERKKTSHLRGNRYEVVPPVREARKKPDSRGTDYDSWGEESDEDPTPDPTAYMPYQYGVPPVVFGAPFPMFFHPPPPPIHHHQSRRRRRNENDYPQSGIKSPNYGQTRNPLGERYEDVNRSVPSKGKRKSKQNRVHFSQPNPAPNGYYGYPGYPAFMPYPGYFPQPYEDPNKRKHEDSKYKYIEPRDTPYSPSGVYGDHVYNRFKDHPDQLLAFYMKDHPLFSENLVNWLVNQWLDDFIPDLLYDAISELGNAPSAVDTMMGRVRDDILGDILPGQIHEVVRSTLSEMVDEYMLYSQTDADPLESFLTRLLNDAVQEAAGDVVKETIREMARDHVDDKHHGIVYDDLFEDYMDDVGTSIVQDAIFELMYEDFLRDEVIHGEVEELLTEVAKETLSHYDNKVMRRELKVVSKQAGDRLMESIMLDYLLQLVARQGHVWTESDHANKYMDDVMNNILMEKLLETILNRRKTINNKPLRKIHQKVVADAALDVCLQQLSATLDEDLLDVDEYERGVMEPYVSHNTPLIELS
ncbi:uncharacterized protein LOC127860095 isoform X2 [Dreissena polymorpha]|uniref:uncharacterized protein LOC127860095 isoform X2 n=1 Tax=Dreissena polymorpha TaxID=45954 RepID=UPI002265444E|nr:uncharacterized protein LOC127860095 isoform X2 [Dreissena polymorpha]